MTTNNSPGQSGALQDNPAAKKLLDILSSGAPEYDGHKHSLCRFCWHRGKASCPFGSNLFGMCFEFQAASPLSELENQVLQYLQTPSNHNSEARLAA